jgi:1,4-dihydroxy-2-naphthoate octaprenyltransferase
MIVKNLLKAIKPFRLASMLATYALGAGLVQYVRHMKDWGALIQGGLFLLFVILSIELLKILGQLRDIKNWPKDANLNEIKRLRWVIVLVIATFLTAAMTIFVDWMIRRFLWDGLTFLILGFVILGGVYYLSDVRQALRPYKMLIEALLFVVFPPAIAYFTQSAEPHRLLTLVVPGLIPVYLAYRLLTDLKTFHEDLRTEKLTSVTHVGWEKAMVFHNALILLAYLIFAMVALIGFPWFILWPVFLTLPIGLVEIWLMEGVRRGKKPLWGLMQFANACVLFIPIYLLGFAFWIR